MVEHIESVNATRNGDGAQLCQRFHCNPSQIGVTATERCWYHVHRAAPASANNCAAGLFLIELHGDASLHGGSRWITVPQKAAWSMMQESRASRVQMAAWLRPRWNIIDRCAPFPARSRRRWLPNGLALGTRHRWKGEWKRQPHEPPILLSDSGLHEF